jgi:pSer/pThr/pTyr-binding forkhead associated (FHA) protein
MPDFVTGFQPEPTLTLAPPDVDSDSDAILKQSADPNVLILDFTDRPQVAINVPINEQLYLGRFHENDPFIHRLDLTDHQGFTKGVSRVHAQIRHAENGWWIEDLGSSNGTWLNRERLAPNEPTRLEIRNTIQLANLRFHLFLPHKVFSGMTLPINTGTSRPMHVIQVEDDKHLREILEVTFREADANMNLHQFVSADDAVEYIEKNGHSVDLFLLDIRLPGVLNGLTLAAKIRELKCPGYIILSSAYTSPGLDVLKSLNAEYLPKPLHILEIAPRLLSYRLKEEAPPKTAELPVIPVELPVVEPAVPEEPLEAPKSEPPKSEAPKLTEPVVSQPTLEAKEPPAQAAIVPDEPEDDTLVVRPKELLLPEQITIGGDPDFQATRPAALRPVVPQRSYSIEAVPEEEQQTGPYRSNLARMIRRLLHL